MATPMNTTVAPSTKRGSPMKALRWSLPLAIFLVVVAFLFVGLFRDPREVPSPLIGKPAPTFTLAQLHKPNERLSTAAVTRTLLEADASRARRGELVDKLAAAYILQGCLDVLDGLREEGDFLEE